MHAMRSMSHLDVYMSKFLLEKWFPDATLLDIYRLINNGVHQREGSPFQMYMLNDTSRPRTSEMCRWLSQQGFSQKAISEMLNISQAAVSQGIERCGRIPFEKRYKNNLMQQWQANAPK